MIYFLLSPETGRVKIGYTGGSVGQRKQRHEASSPCDLKFLGMIPGSDIDEKRLHQRFRRFRVKGKREWFHTNEELETFIRDSVGAFPTNLLPLVEADERIGELWHEALLWNLNVGPKFCANAIWYGYSGHSGLKNKLIKLVGWLREEGPARLRTAEAYAIALDAIYEALPGCQNCGCLRFEDFM